MFTHLIVPLDGSPQAAVALPLARTIAQRTGAELVLVRVVPGYQLDPPKTAVALEYLEGVARELADLRVQLVIARGDDIAAVLIGRVELHNADLVVMAPHGRGGLRRVMAGSVANRLIARSPAPVVVLRPGARRGRTLTRLLVPVDGSALQGAAVNMARVLASTFSMHVCVLRVARGGGSRSSRADEAELQAARASVEQLTHALRHAGVAADGRVELGPVAHTICGVADEVGADLVIMATHGRTGLARAVRGSVTDEVVRAVHAPVLLVRRPLGQRRDPAAHTAAPTPD
jgi:nucleotide-binding universal stress UspA family protein